MFSSQVLAEKGTFWNPILPHITYSRIKTTEPKWLILVYFFLGEDSPSTDASHYISLLPEVFRSVFWATLYMSPHSVKPWMKVTYDIPLKPLFHRDCMKTITN